MGRIRDARRLSLKMYDMYMRTRTPAYQCFCEHRASHVPTLGACRVEV